MILYYLFAGVLLALLFSHKLREADDIDPIYHWGKLSVIYGASCLRIQNVFLTYSFTHVKEFWISFINYWLVDILHIGKIICIHSLVWEGDRIDFRFLIFVRVCWRRIKIECSYDNFTIWLLIDSIDFLRSWYNLLFLDDRADFARRIIWYTTLVHLLLLVLGTLFGIVELLLNLAVIVSLLERKSIAAGDGAISRCLQ